MDEHRDRPADDDNVTLADLINAGLLVPGMRLFRRFAGQEVEASLSQDGSIVIDGAKYASPSMAAQSVIQRLAPGTTPNRNGWRWWNVVGTNGVEHDLDYARRQYRLRSGEAPASHPSQQSAGGAGISQVRTGELLKEVLAVLIERGPLAVAEVLRSVRELVRLNDYELSRNKSGQVRWETNVHWYSVDTVRAGWLRKEAGIWSITDQGREALALPTIDFWPAAHQAYVDWQRTQKQSRSVEVVELGEWSPEDVEDLRTVIEGREGSVWWVNQGGTFEAERDGGYLWAPRANRAGVPMSHHLAVGKLRPGDRVIHYANGAIRAVSRVVSDPIESERPTELPEGAWSKDGILARVEYHSLMKALGLQTIPLQLRTTDAGPFTQDGSVRQGYLYQLSEPFVSGLVDLLALQGRETVVDLRDTLRSMEVKPLVLSSSVIGGLTAALESGNHVIVLGPPGTGKTHLVELAAKAATKAHYTSGYVLTTASADWSTFDTIGGYMPNPKRPNELEFQPGIFLEALAADHWVILDEINRADADKAFGALLTLLAGFDVTLNFRDNEGTRYKLVRSQQRRSHYDRATATYHIGRNWRILATMNTRDKNSLFALSYAFMRRFSFVYVGPSTPDQLSEILGHSQAVPAAISAALAIAGSVPIAMGAALVQDIAHFISGHDEIEQGIENAVIAYVLPQLEGREDRLVRTDLVRLRQALGLPTAVEATWLSAAGILLGVEGKPPVTTAEDAADTDDDIDLDA